MYYVGYFSIGRRVVKTDNIKNDTISATSAGFAHELPLVTDCGTHRTPEILGLTVLELKPSSRYITVTGARRSVTTDVQRLAVQAEHTQDTT